MGAVIQIVLKISWWFLFYAHFCFAMVYSMLKQLFTSVSVNSARIFTSERDTQQVDFLVLPMILV